MRISVCMITYNHRQYIRNAMDSVLAQQTNHDLHLYIGDDGSTDGTLNIIEDYRSKHPQTITIVTRSGHVGMMENFLLTLAACDGEYIAILEGDDFWTDPTKIQLQANFLDQHPDYTICFTTAHVVRDGLLINQELPPTEYRRANLDLTDLLRTNFIPTCTVLFRAIHLDQFRTLHRPLPYWFANLNMGDYPLHLLNASYGKIGFLPQATASYRIHAGGNFSQRSAITNNESVITMIKTIKQFLQKPYQKKADASIKLYFHAMLQMSRQAGRRDEARRYLWRALRLPRSSQFVSFKDELQAFLALYLFR